MKPGSNSTRPLIFGIGTVECIVAVIKGSWSGLGLLSVRFNSRLTKKRTRERERDIETDRERELSAAVWLHKLWQQGEKRVQRSLVLISGFCRACGESVDRETTSE